MSKMRFVSGRDVLRFFGVDHHRGCNSRMYSDPDSVEAVKACDCDAIEREELVEYLDRLIRQERGATERAVQLSEHARQALKRIDTIRANRP